MSDRVSEIRARLKRIEKIPTDGVGIGTYLNDVRELLAALDAQPEGGPRECSLCAHDEVVNGYCTALVPICSDDYHGTRFCGCKCVFKALAAQPSPSLADAIAKVRAMQNRFQQAADSSTLPNDLTASRDTAVANALTRLLSDLESLTPSDVVLVSKEEAAKVCDGLVTFDPDHEKYTPEDEFVPCGWCDGLERAAERIRSLPAYGDRKE